MRRIIDVLKEINDSFTTDERLCYFCIGISVAAVNICTLF